MDANQLVLIVSKCLDDNGVITYSTGTGYYITPSLILTANHVLYGARNGEIKGRNEGNSQWTILTPVWQSEELDAALLRSEAKLSSHHIQWQEQPFESNIEWNSIGYPSASRETIDDKSHFSTSGLSGTLYSGGGGGQLKKRRLDLTVMAPPQPVSKWSGTSGAPVFVKDKIAGIITRIPKDFVERLQGTPAFELLKDATFRALLNDDTFKIPFINDWAILLGTENTNQKMFSSAAESAMDKCYPDGYESNYFNTADILADAGAFLNFVKLLCKAPILIVDATNYDPGVMLLIGIRSVVRRGITIVTTSSPLAEEDLSKLPFNIQQIKLLSLNPKSFRQGGAITSKDKLINAITEGKNLSKVNIHYLDLPAYDAVRNTIVFDIPAIKDKVLILCPFNKDYSETFFTFLQNNLSFLTDTKNIIRMLDISSPQLVSQSLYEHIRWARVCIVDWTNWLPNVFYELGVRLASSSVAPINLISANELVSIPDGSQKKLLQNLFRPFSYNYKQDQFPDEVEKNFNFIYGTNFDLFQGADLSMIYPGSVYSIVEKNFDWTQEENVTAAPHKFIAGQLEREFGKDIQEEGGYNVLYSANKGYKAALQERIRQYWLCAWYYLLNKHEFSEFENDQAKRDELTRIGESTMQALDIEAYRPVKEKIMEIIDKLENI